MYKKTNILIIVILSAVFVLNVNAQRRKGDKYFNDLAYVQAIKCYEKAIEKNPDNQHVIKMLAESYRLIRNMEEAEIWYAKLVRLYDTVPDDIYHYAQILKSNQNYNEAIVWIDKYYQISKSTWAKNHLSDINYHVKLSENLLGYKIVNLSINSEQADFGPAFYKDEIVFSSSRKMEESASSLYPWDNQPYLKLFKAKKRDDRELTDIKDLFKDVSSKYHEGPASYSIIDNVIYFTRNSQIKREGSKKENKLKIFKATLKNDEWINIESLSFNNDDYSCGHPSISVDGTRLYFISDMPDGYGGTDIYYCDKIDDDWSDPRNAGSYINTEGDEMFPFIHENGTLYFSSDGHVGLGGWDVFAYSENSPQVHEIVNLGSSINSSKDDFGFICDRDGKSGYFSSNRSGGIGSDDIYSFTKVSLKIIGTTTNMANNAPLENVNVTLVNANGIEIETIATDQSGIFEFNIAEGKTYKLFFEKDGFEKIEIDIDGTEKIENGFIEKDIALSTEEFLLKLNEAICLQNIFYNYDSYELQREALAELDKLVTLLFEYPDIIIEIGSHTDSRALDNYNYWLSQERAISVANYIISQGIDKSRIRGKGYGESKLLNHCRNGVECSEFEHQVNRRTEFTIIGIDKYPELNIHPDNIKNESTDDIPEFLSAYLDGDASVIQDKYGEINNIYYAIADKKKSDFTNQEESLKYSVVAGSFDKITSARRYMEKLKSNGYKTDVLTTNGFYRVIIASSDNYDEVYSYLNMAKQTLRKDVWIMRHF